MSNHPGLDQTLERLNRLRDAAGDFAAREAKLEKEFHARLAGAGRLREGALEEEMNRLTAEISEADAAYAAAQKATWAAYEKRKLGIGEARTASKEQALQKIEKHLGARKYELQKRLIQAERDRDAGKAAAAAALEDLREKQALEEGNLAALERTAREAFRGYGRFARLLARNSRITEADPLHDERQMLTELRSLLQQADGALARYRKNALPQVFRLAPMWLVALVCLMPLTPMLLRKLGVSSVPAGYSQPLALALTGAMLGAAIMLFFIRARGAGPAAAEIAGVLGRARRLCDASLHWAATHHQAELERYEAGYQNMAKAIDQELREAVNENLNYKGTFREQVDEKTMRINARSERLREQKLKRLEAAHAEAGGRLRQQLEARQGEALRTAEELEAKLKTEHAANWRTLEAEWRGVTQPVYDAMDAARADAEKLFPAWPRVMDHWTPPKAFAQSAKFGQLDVDLATLCEAMPQDPRLAPPGPARFSVPLLLAYPEQGSILFESSGGRREEMIGALNNVILRLLSVSPPGRLNFSILDPVGLGQNFAGIMHLADYEAQIINNRIWTQAQQIEQRLADLNEHMEKVIQMYLRNEYKTIAEYNEQAGNIAEKYHFLVVADFPANFSETAVKRLMSIAASGARCGVYTLIHWDHRQTGPPEFVPDELRKSSVVIAARGKEAALAGKNLPGTALLLDAPPAAEAATEFIHEVGRSSRDSSRVEVPFAHVAPPEAEEWTLDTSGELRVAIGRTGATKLQYLAIGKGTRQHALVAGKTGSGKSTLFHVIITNLALWCSPEQVEFYLVDFKKGVEFKCYATNRLPHARVVAIESDREFGLSVLQRVDDELRRRGDLFRKIGAQDIPGYQRAGGKEPMPRSLLLIDEFQEFFTEDDKISQTASVLLDRIVRQGRAFGIHVVLGSQTLGGAYTLARTTIGQMVIRIALQCNEADAYLIMDENNPAPRLLSRPGEGIYNDAAGSVEGNNPFQVVWLPDDVRDQYLGKVRALADRKPGAYPAPVVFEGNAPSDVRENAALQELLATPATVAPVSPRIWLGAPNSIKGPTEAVFHRQSGNNLLMVGQRDEAALAMLSAALVALSAQYPAGTAKFLVFDGNPPGSAQREYLERLARAIPRDLTLVKNQELAETMTGLAAELKKRMEDGGAAATPVFLIFNGLQKFGKLRHEEDFSFGGGVGDAPNPGAQLNQIITEGPAHGMHVVATVDSFNNVNRSLSRKALSEFEMRVLFQMSVNDSASLIDSPKAATLGLHRALFYNEQEGYLETFRPYALPDGEWVEAAGGRMR